MYQGWQPFIHYQYRMLGLHLVKEVVLMTRELRANCKGKHEDCIWRTEKGISCLKFERIKMWLEFGIEHFGCQDFCQYEFWPDEFIKNSFKTFVGNIQFLTKGLWSFNDQHFKRITLPFFIKALKSTTLTSVDHVTQRGSTDRCISLCLTFKTLKFGKEKLNSTV